MWVVAAAGTLVGLLLVVANLAPARWDASELLHIGLDPPAFVDYGRQQLGRVRLETGLGHDGKFFFVQANDPFYRNVDGHGYLLDRPAIRAQRMLYPMLASSFGLLPAKGVVWGLIVVNLIALAVGSLAAARLAQAWGSSPWLAAAFFLNPGVLSDLLLDTAGVLTWSLALVSVLALARRRYGAGVAAMAGSVLARETSVLILLGMALAHWRERRRVPWALILVPLGFAVAWWAYTASRLGPGMQAAAQSFSLPPFTGLREAASRWFATPGWDLIAGLAVVAACVEVVRRTLRRPTGLLMGATAVSLMLPFLSMPVLYHHFDINRVFAPVFTVLIFELFQRLARRPVSLIGRRERRRVLPGPGKPPPSRGEARGPEREA